MMLLGNAKNNCLFATIIESTCNTHFEQLVFTQKVEAHAPLLLLMIAIGQRRVSTLSKTACRGPLAGACGPLSYCSSQALSYRSNPTCVCGLGACQHGLRMW